MLLPGAAGALAPGQRLDLDPLTGFEVTVASNGLLPTGQRAVVIRETGKAYPAEWTYDGASGILQAFRLDNRSLNTSVQLHLTRVTPGN